MPETGPLIAILGAGPSGLMFARLLEINHIDYIIFERNQHASEVGQGGTLDIHTESGQHALKEGGLHDKFRIHARYDGQTLRVADQQGNVIYSRDDEGQEEAPEIDRKDLRALLLRSVPPQKLKWGSRVQSVQRDTNGSISIHLADGSAERGFRLVVGADGAWSKARSLITSAMPHYSGYHYLQTSVNPSNAYYPTMSSQVGPGSWMAIGSGKQLAAQRLGDGSYNIYAGLPLPEHWTTSSYDVSDSSALRQKLLETDFADWASELTDWIKHSDGDFHAWPLYSMSTECLKWRSVLGIALIGDAAHVTVPFVGEGVNCALHDSLQLAQQIVKSGLERPDEAVSEYEKLMFPRAIDPITRSHASGELLFAEDAPKGFKAMVAGSASED